jgi:hypothetical protein
VDSLGVDEGGEAIDHKRAPEHDDDDALSRNRGKRTRSKAFAVARTREWTKARSSTLDHY